MSDGLRVEILSGVAAVDAAQWTRLFPDDAEGAAYYAACEASKPRGFTMAAAIAFDGEMIVAAVPLFRIDFRLDMPLQGGARKIGAWLAEKIPFLMVWPVLGLGSPLAERCHLGFAPDLDTHGKQAALAALLAGIERYAHTQKIGLVAIKDLAGAEATDLEGTIAEAGFSRTTSLPVAVLDLPYADDAAYLAGLSSATRKDLRRKLKGAGAVRVEFRSDIDDVESEIAALYASTRQESDLDYGDFEELPEGYFGATMRGINAATTETASARAVMALYWVGDVLAAFNLLFVEKSRVIDKFLGMRYPLARENDIYFLSWMQNIRFCISQRIPRLQSGQTAYAVKLRLGSRLEPSLIYFRHRNLLANALLRLAARFIAFDKMDPDLVAYRTRTEKN